MSLTSPSGIFGGGHGFDTTRWSVVLAAGNHGSPESDEALALLCRDYWYPLYAYVRRRVRDAHEAQDLTQAFFAKLLEKNYVADAQRDRGRFRSFLLASLKHFLANERDRANATKRGGGRPAISLDFDDAESRYSLEPADHETPQRAFDRQWAQTLLQRVLGALRDEFHHAGKESQFDQLKPMICGRPVGAAYDRAAAALGISVQAAYVAAHRLRLRYRELLRAEIAQTVADAGEVDEEIAELFTALGS